MTTLNVDGWFPEENQVVLDRLIRDRDVRSVIEVGCFVGKATIWFAERVDHVTAIDLFEPLTEVYINSAALKRVADNMLTEFQHNTAMFDNVTAIQASSEKAAQMGLIADLVYIDAAHDYENVKRDIQMWYPQARKVLCGDDNTFGWPGVQRAIRESVLPIDYSQRVWWVNK